MRTLIAKIDGGFNFFDYHISHNQLLLRNNYVVDEEYHNLDILFEGVFFLQTATYGFYDGFELYEGDTSDQERIAPFIYEDPILRSRKVYILKANEQEYFICAVSVNVNTNDLPVDKTSILMKKE